MGFWFFRECSKYLVCRFSLISDEYFLGLVFDMEMSVFILVSIMVFGVVWVWGLLGWKRIGFDLFELIGFLRWVWDIFEVLYIFLDGDYGGFGMM